MRWLTKRRLIKFAWIFGGLLVAVFLLGYAVHLRSKSAVEDYMRQLRAAGEKLTIAELIPPRVAPERNGAGVFREAAAMTAFPTGVLEDNPPSAMRMVAPGKAMIGWRQADLRDAKTNSWDEVDIALEQRAGKLELLHRAAQFPALDFEVNYEGGYKELRLPHLDRIKGNVQLLSAAVVSDLHRDDVSSAVTYLHTMLVLVKNYDERWGISQLVRIAMASIAFNANWELLQAPGLTDPQLAMLQRDWEGMEFVQARENAQLMERAAWLDLMASRNRTPGDPLGLIPGEGSAAGSAGSGGWPGGLGELPKTIWNGARRGVSGVLWRVSWRYADELRALQGEQVLVETLRQVRTNGSFSDALAERDRKLNALGLGVTRTKENFDWLWDALDAGMIRGAISRSRVSALTHAFDRLLRVEAVRQLAVTAIALKLFELRHGTVPSDLTALIPEFLPAVPLDPVDGKPLRYRKNADGTFLLYSIGDDGKDDGGDPTGTTPSFYWERGRDWVWPQPATPEEIQDYEERRAATRR